ncbi:hypothetical protein [Burkholderia sp. Bp8992]|uniref:hypothetical protein n=1 Tax=Burkholderia sp. Bp8992 TaxID=2184554 RepID=UPI00162A5D38|nr:hypothetical protein [Burkholderia sp. Bp8992]
MSLRGEGRHFAGELGIWCDHATDSDGGFHSPSSNDYLFDEWRGCRNASGGSVLRRTHRHVADVHPSQPFSQRRNIVRTVQSLELPLRFLPEWGRSFVQAPSLLGEFDKAVSAVGGTVDRAAHAKRLLARTPSAPATSAMRIMVGCRC